MCRVPRPCSFVDVFMDIAKQFSGGSFCVQFVRGAKDSQIPILRPSCAQLVEPFAMHGAEYADRSCVYVDVCRLGQRDMVVPVTLIIILYSRGVHAGELVRGIAFVDTGRSRKPQVLATQGHWLTYCSCSKA